MIALTIMAKLVVDTEELYLALWDEGSTTQP
ncbi:unnamed protein product, partial [marine sediment metagenome]